MKVALDAIPMPLTLRSDKLETAPESPEGTAENSPRRKPWVGFENKQALGEGDRFAWRGLSPRSGASIWGMPTHGLRRGLFSVASFGGSWPSPNCRSNVILQSKWHWDAILPHIESQTRSE